MNGQSAGMVKIELLDSALKECYGVNMMIPENKALLGDRNGKWKIAGERFSEPEYNAVQTAHVLVSIIILCWNNLEYTRKCIESIKENTPLSYQLVIVNNGSSDETSSYIKAMLNKGDILIDNITNMGFSSANNLGSRVAAGKYLLFLNNDCEVGPGWFEQLIEAAQDNCVVGPSLGVLIKNDDKKLIDYRGRCFDESDLMSYLEGWCLLIKKKDFFSIGGFDIQFDPFLSEDADFSFRCREIGLNIKSLPNLPVLHHRSKSLKMHTNVRAISNLNNAKLYKKWIESGRLFAKRNKEPVRPNSLIQRQSAPYERVILTEL